MQIHSQEFLTRRRMTFDVINRPHTTDPANRAQPRDRCRHIRGQGATHLEPPLSAATLGRRPEPLGDHPRAEPSDPPQKALRSTPGPGCGCRLRSEQALGDPGRLPPGKPREDPPPRPPYRDRIVPTGDPQEPPPSRRQRGRATGSARMRSADRAIQGPEEQVEQFAVQGRTADRSRQWRRRGSPPATAEPAKVVGDDTPSDGQKPGPGTGVPPEVDQGAPYAGGSNILGQVIGIGRAGQMSTEAPHVGLGRAG